MSTSSKASTAATNLIPKPSLGQYVFAEKLGSGTYATVYKAYRKTGIREVVAIKCVLRKSLNKASTENLLTEIELLKRLKHDHIVELKDFQWDTSYIYLVMEYCSNGDLSRFIRSRRALPEHVVKRFLQQIASAIKFLWDNNVAHMDLKPQNILLTSHSQPQIKLADFGFAKYLYDGDNLHAMRGSPLYMAPEIICHGQYDNRVDLWSVGVILYECLFGQAPFASKSFSELGKKIWDEKPIEIPQGFDVSDSARDLTIRLLKRDPDERIAFAEFFAHPFVDMEHLPNQDSLGNAIKIVTEAVKRDEKGDYKAAIKLYCDALAFFMPAIHYEPSRQKKNALRAKVKQYMDRAEELKQIMKPQSLSMQSLEKPVTEILGDKVLEESAEKRKSNPDGAKQIANGKDPSKSPKTDPSANKQSTNHTELSRSPCHQNPIDELLKLSKDSKELTTALKIIKGAIHEEQMEDYKQCLQHFEMGLGIVLKLLPNEPKGKRKDLLNSQVTNWMKRAEEIKSYLEVRHLKTNDEGMLEDETEISQSKNCILQ